MTDEELFAVEDDKKLANGGDNNDYDGVLTAEERMQLDSALRMGNSDGLCENDEHGVACQENGSGGSYENCESNDAVDDYDDVLTAEERMELDSALRMGNSDGLSEEDVGDVKKAKDKNSKKKKKKEPTSKSQGESEYKKGLRPLLWLTSDFPLKTDELLLLLDILANKIKVIRRLGELLTTKLPHSAFPVKVAIPIVRPCHFYKI